MNQALLEDESIYQTADLSLATTLSLFFPIENLDRDNPRKTSFIFKRSQKLDALIANYWKGRITVEPQTYFNQLRVIKSRLYGE